MTIGNSVYGQQLLDTQAGNVTGFTLATNADLNGIAPQTLGTWSLRAQFVSPMLGNPSYEIAHGTIFGSGVQYTSPPEAPWAGTLYSLVVTWRIPNLSWELAWQVVDGTTGLKGAKGDPGTDGATGATGPQANFLLLPRPRSPLVHRADSSSPSWVSSLSTGGSHPNEYGTTMAWSQDSDGEYRQCLTGSTINTDIAIDANAAPTPNFGCRWGILFKPVATGNVREFIGVAAGNGFNSSDTISSAGTGFSFSFSRGDAHYLCATCDGVTANVQSTGVARVAGTPVWLCADEPPGGPVSFYVNGNLVATSSVNRRSDSSAYFLQARLRNLTAAVQSFKLQQFTIEAYSG